MLNIILLLTLIGRDPNVGTAGFDLLNITVPARPAAMGNATIADAGDAFGFFFNPAGLVDMEESRLGTTYMNYLAGVQLGSLSYAKPLDDKGVGIGLTYLNSGAMKRTDAVGNEQGTFSVGYFNFDFAFGYLLTEPVALGLGLKGLYGKIDTFFTVGAGANIGGSFLLPIEGLHFGIAIRNIGMVFKPFRAEKDKLPLDFGAGLNYSTNSLNLNLDLTKPLYSRFGIRAGVEYWLTSFLAARTGYNSFGSDLKTGGGSDIFGGFSLGLGVKVLSYQLDYAFTPMLALGRVHRFTLSFAL
uniref:PorV/PorQ family protein n=1 Tax=candidate division WOR-3 bacterium TaxID=2052148 RepID=A0A7C6EEW0_UNCW3